jgi:hypothetical protein
MRILLLADYYPAYLKAFHSRHADSAQSYDHAAEELLGDYFGSFVSYRNHFRKIGHACELVIGNDYALQNKWLSEAGLPADAGPDTKFRSVLKRIEVYRPDLIFMGSMFDYFGGFVAAASRLTPNIFVWIACPYPGNLDFTGVRCVLSSVDSFVDQFRALGLASERLDAAFDADILAAVGEVPKRYDVTFIGGMSSRTHAYRVRMLKGLLRAGVEVDLWGYGLDRGLLPNPLRKRFGGEIWGIDYYRVLAESRLTLNFHIDVAKTSGFTGNMRTFEATGCGATLVSDSSGELARLFEPGVEVVTYESPDDLVDRIRDLLADDAQRRNIARRGQERCLREHGYEVRIRDFEGILGRHIH